MKEKNGIKNYIILAVLFIFTIFIAISLLNIYKSYSSQNKTSLLSDTITEVKEEEINNFLSERDSVIIYICDVTNPKCRSFEKRFKNYILNNDLRDEIFYYNIEKSDEFYSKYKSDTLYKKMYGVPSILVFKDSRIIDILSSKNNISMEQVRLFLEDYVD